MSDNKPPVERFTFGEVLVLLSFIIAIGQMTQCAG